MIRIAAVIISLVSMASTASTATPTAGTTTTTPPAAATMEVVVHPEGARVTRRLDLPCAARARVVFGEVTPAADPDTFRATVSEGTIDGVRWEQRRRTAAFADRAATLDRTLRDLDARISALEQRLARTDQSSEVRGGFLAVTEKLVTEQMWQGRPDLPAWQAALDAVVRTGLEAEQARTTATAQKRELDRRRVNLRIERAALEHGNARSAHLVEVVATCPAGRKAQVRLSYLVTGAGWTPSYEARERAGQVELAAFVTVHQTTGEDWQAARLTLSTAAPRQDVRPPELTPLRVYAGHRHEGPAIVARDEEVPAAPGVDRVAAAGTGSRVQAAPQGLSVQLVVPDPADVPGDGREVRLLAGRTRGQSRLQLVAVPRLAAPVFRVAELTNTAPFPLLPGTVDIYRDGGFLSRDRLEATPIGGRFRLGFGVEDRVRVRRRVLEETDRKAGLFGTSRHHRFAYRFEVTSRLPRPVEVDLQDMIPVSELADVAVLLEPRTTGGHQLDRRDGHIRWPLRLSPGVEKRVELAFRVEVPSKYD